MAQFIAELRKEKGMTQKDLAEQLGLTDKAVSKWERGLSCPDISLLSKLALVLGVTANELLSGARSEPAAPEMEAVFESALQYADVATKGKIAEGKRWKSVSITAGIVLSLFLLLLGISEIEIYPASPISFLPTAFLAFIAIVGISVSVVFRKYTIATGLFWTTSTYGTVYCFSSFAEPTAELINTTAVFPKGYLPHYTFVIASAFITLGLLVFLIARGKKVSSKNARFSAALTGLAVIVISILTIKGIMNYTNFNVPGMGVDPRFTITIFLTIILNFVSLTLLAMRSIKHKVQPTS